MKTFLALYRGDTISSAKLVAVGVDPELVSYVAARLLAEKHEEDDPAVGKIIDGRRRALRIIKREADSFKD